MANDGRARSITPHLRIVRYIAPLPQAPSSRPAVAPREARALEFFQLRTAPELGGALSGEAWSRYTLQACHEKAVLHAVVAVSSLHEHYEKADYSSVLDLQFSMQQYSKAIQEIVKIDSTKLATVTDVALITCLLFAMFESLQGHYTSALTHINSGIKIINEHQISGKAAQRSSDAYSLSVHLFNCMETQMLEIGDLRGQYSCPEVSLCAPLHFPAIFSSVEEAATSLEIFRCAHMRLSNYCQELPPSADNVQENINKSRRELIEALENWSRAFESMLNSYPRTQDVTFHANTSEVLLLQIHKAVSKIGLRLTSTSVENALDTFGPEFRAITNDADRFIIQGTPNVQQEPREESPILTTSSCSQNPGLTSTHPSLLAKSYSKGDSIEPRLIRAIKPTFSIGLGIVMPLFIVCVHCRDPQIRHRALYLLKICNRKEGLWDSKLTARVAETVISLEEQEALRYSQGPGQVPGHARIQILWVKFAPKKQAIVTYRQGGVEAASAISSLHPVDHTQILQW